MTPLSRLVGKSTPSNTTAAGSAKPAGEGRGTALKGLRGLLLLHTRKINLLALRQCKEMSPPDSHPRGRRT